MAAASPFTLVAMVPVVTVRQWPELRRWRVNRMPFPAMLGSSPAVKRGQCVERVQQLVR
jgi:hypothetical protein